MNIHTQPAAQLTYFTKLYAYTWALRYSCQDTNLWHTIKDTIMDADRDYRRWDPDECNGRGAWVVDESVLDSLEAYFPSMKRDRESIATGDCPF